MCHVALIAGNTSSSAKTNAVLEAAQSILRRRGAHVSVVAVHRLPPEALLSARSDSGAIQDAFCEINRADGVVIATPICKAAYTGALKAFLDLLPSDALCDKVILPIATGSASVNTFALDYALAPVLASLGASRILRGLAIADAQVQFAHGGMPHLESEAARNLRESLSELADAIAAHSEPLPVYAPIIEGAFDFEASPLQLEGFQR